MSQETNKKVAFRLSQVFAINTFSGNERAYNVEKFNQMANELAEAVMEILNEKDSESASLRQEVERVKEESNKWEKMYSDIVRKLLPEIDYLRFENNKMMLTYNNLCKGYESQLDLAVGALGKINLGLFSAQTHKEEWMRMREIAEAALNQLKGREKP